MTAKPPSLPDLSSRPITFGRPPGPKEGAKAVLQPKRGRPAGPTTRAIDALERIARALEHIAGIHTPQLPIDAESGDWFAYTDDADGFRDELRELDAILGGRRAPRDEEEQARALLFGPGER